MARAKSENISNADKFPRKCPVCSGTGKVLCDKWKNYYQQLLQGKEAREPGAPKQFLRCGGCDGGGFLLTESDKRYIEIIGGMASQKIEEIASELEESLSAVKEEIFAEIDKRLLFAARAIGGSLGLEVDGWESILPRVAEAMVSQVKRQIQQEQETLK